MSKELEAYWKIDHTCCLNDTRMQFCLINEDTEDRDCRDVYEMADCLDIIEHALKRLNYIDENKIYCISENYLQDIKKIKAFKIIKEKRVNLYHFDYVQSFPIDEQLERYNDTWYVREKDFLTKEEYELLKGCCYEI